MTRLHLTLRVCERFGIDPLGGSALAGVVQLLLAPGTEIEQLYGYHRMREAEEAAMRGVGGG